MSELVVIEKIKPLDVFKSGGSDSIVDQIRKKVSEFTPDTSTAKGRKEIASMAYKVSQSKTALDGLGKNLVEDEKKRLKLIDKERKKIKDELDILRDEVRQPLTDWEAEEEKRLAAETLAKEIEQAHIEAINENDLFDRQKAIEEQEAKLAAEKEAIRLKEEAKEKERQRIAREERLKKEAAEKAKHEAEEKAEAERQAAAKREADAIAAKERAEREKQEAEQKRIKAEKQAEIDKQEAINAAKREAEEEAQRKEAARLRVLEMEAEKARVKAANLSHRKKVNNEALKCLKAHGMETDKAKELITAIAKGEILNVTINY